MKTFICLWFVLSFMDQSLCGDKTRIKAKTGDRVLLPCDATRFKPIKVVEWSKPDEDKYVIFCRNQNSDPVITEDQYKDRVELVDRTTGNVSIYLRDVRTNDSGIYECYVQGGRGRTKREVNLISTIHLHVAADPPPGKQDGNSRSHAFLVAVSAFAAVFAVVSMVMIAVIRRKRTKTPSPPDDAEEPQLI